MWAPMEPRIKGTRPLLELAAESIAQTSGVAETVVDVIHGRAFRHYAEGLRQYVSIRLRDSGQGPRVLRELRAVAATRGAEELVQPPGIRARLYALARELAVPGNDDETAELDGDEDGDEGTDANTGRTSTGNVIIGNASDSATATDRLRWRKPSAPGGQKRLGAIRESLSTEEAELVELRYARELHVEEISHVVSRPESEIENILDRAVELARPLLEEGEEPADLLFEAFSLAPPEPADGDDAVDSGVAALPAGTVLGHRYAIKERVGSGSFADVYRASDTEVPGHVVAVKLLHQPSLSTESRQSALRELRLIASVFHPSIVEFKDHGWFEGRLWFVMPWYEGETLEERITRGPLRRVEAKRIFGHLARALAAMHAVGVRHQDIKPDNIFLARLKHMGLEEGDGVLPVLLDLGVAAKEAEMVVAGTPTYFAPEVAAQFASVPAPHRPGPKADVFSLALSLRNALEPETQEDVAAGAVERFIERRAAGKPDLFTKPDLKFLDPSFGRWLNANPEERPTAEELALELAILTRPEDRRNRLKRVMKWAAPSLLALMSVFAATVIILGNQARGPRDRGRTGPDGSGGNQSRARGRDDQAVGTRRGRGGDSRPLRVERADSRRAGQSPGGHGRIAWAHAQPTLGRTATIPQPAWRPQPIQNGKHAADGPAAHDRRRPRTNAGRAHRLDRALDPNSGQPRSSRGIPPERTIAGHPTRGATRRRPTSERRSGDPRRIARRPNPNP